MLYPVAFLTMQILRQGAQSRKMWLPRQLFIYRAARKNRLVETGLQLEPPAAASGARGDLC